VVHGRRGDRWAVAEHTRGGDGNSTEQKIQPPPAWNLARAVRVSVLELSASCRSIPARPTRRGTTVAHPGGQSPGSGRPGCTIC
jgi:hypothetical protein